MRRILLIILALAVFVGLDAFGLYQVFIGRVVGANDFFIPWRAIRALLLEGLDPYSVEVTHKIQLALEGRIFGPDEHQFAFAYPLYVAWLMAPLVALPYPVAEALWLATLQVASLGAVLLALRVYRPRSNLLLLAGLSLWSLFVYPTARALILGQLSVIVFFLLVVAIWAIHARQDALCGAALALATLKPQMVFLVIPLLLAWAWHLKRWRVLTGFAATLAVLLVSSLILMPTWPLAFARSLTEYVRYTDVGSPVEIGVTLLWPGAQAIAGLLSVVLIAYLGFVAWREARAGWPRWDWLVGLALAITSLVAVRTATTNQVVLLVPLFYWLRQTSRTWSIVVLLSLLVVPWLLFAPTQPYKGWEPSVVYLPWPLFFTTLLILWQPQPNAAGMGCGCRLG